jgi:hypothetical protein
MCFGHIKSRSFVLGTRAAKNSPSIPPKNILEGEVKNSSQDAILAQKGEKGKKEGRLEAGLFCV